MVAVFEPTQTVVLPLMLPATEAAVTMIDTLEDVTDEQTPLVTTTR